MRNSKISLKNIYSIIFYCDKYNYNIFNYLLKNNYYIFLRANFFEKFIDGFFNFRNRELIIETVFI